MTLASAPSAQTTTIRNDWTKAEVEALFAMPFNDLLFNAQAVHRQHFNPNEVQVSTLLSIKPVLALKTVSTARKVLGMIRALKKNDYWKLKKSSSVRKKQSKWAQPVFVWGLLGEIHATETCLTF